MFIVNNFSHVKTYTGGKKKEGRENNNNNKKVSITKIIFFDEYKV